MRRIYLIAVSLFAASLLCSARAEARTHPNTSGLDVQRETSNTCEFRSGPRRGERQRYPDQDPLPVGTSCQDGEGSRGVVVSEGRGKKEMSNTCEFRSGPRRGERQRYPDQDPLPVGTPCHDGRESRGVVVSEREGNDDDNEEEGQEVSNTCEFRSGPRKGQRQRYSDQDPLPVGTPCNDGRSSRGVVVSESRQP